MAASSRDSGSSVLLTPSPTFLHGTEAVPGLPAAGRTLHPWTTTSAAALPVATVLDEMVVVEEEEEDTVIAIEARDASTTKTELVTDHLPVAPRSTVPLADATKTPTAGTTLLPLTPMLTADLPTIGLLETSLPGKVLIRGKDMRAITIAVGVTDEYPAWMRQPPPHPRFFPDQQQVYDYVRLSTQIK